MKPEKVDYNLSLIFFEKALEVVYNEGYNDMTKAFDALDSLKTQFATVTALNVVKRSILGFMDVDFGAEALAKIGITRDQFEKHYGVAKRYVESFRSNRGEL